MDFWTVTVCSLYRLTSVYVYGFELCCTPEGQHSISVAPVSGTGVSIFGEGTSVLLMPSGAVRIVMAANGSARFRV